MKTDTPTTEGHRWNGGTVRSTPTGPDWVIRDPEPEEPLPPPTPPDAKPEEVEEVGKLVEPRRSCFQSMVERFRERKLVQWTAAYLAMGWLVLQLMDVLSDTWGWPIVAQQAVSLLLGFGTLPALVVAWFHGEKGRQDICATEAAIVAATIMGAVFAVWSLCLGAAA